MSRITISTEKSSPRPSRVTHHTNKYFGDQRGQSLLVDLDLEMEKDKNWYEKSKHEFLHDTETMLDELTYDFALGLFAPHQTDS